jgi:cysteinyl-tRNA synthetase
MAELFELVAAANRDDVPGAVEAVSEMLDLVGLGTVAEPERIFEDHGEGTIRITGSGIEEYSSPTSLMAEREAARGAKDYARADEIRDKLAELGYEVRDSADGPRLVPKS